jgi:hypothetical protein
VVELRALLSSSGGTIQLTRCGASDTGCGFLGKRPEILSKPTNATEAARPFKDLSANGNNPLNSVSHSKGALHTIPPSPWSPLPPRRTPVLAAPARRRVGLGSFAWLFCACAGMVRANSLSSNDSTGNVGSHD